MNENRISLSISEETKAEIFEAIHKLNSLFAPILIALDKNDKKRLAKIGDGSLPFVEKVAQYAVSNPEFVPAFMSVEEFQKDLTAFKLFREFSRPLMQVTANLDDTWTLTGSEAGDFSRAYYASVGQAAKMGVPGAQAIYNDLKPRFEAQRVKREPSQTA